MGYDPENAQETDESHRSSVYKQNVPQTPGYVEYGHVEYLPTNQQPPQNPYTSLPNPHEQAVFVQQPTHQVPQSPVYETPPYPVYSQSLPEESKPRRRRVPTALIVLISVVVIVAAIGIPTYVVATRLITHNASSAANSSLSKTYPFSNRLIMDESFTGQTQYWWTTNNECSLQTGSLHTTGTSAAAFNFCSAFEDFGNITIEATVKNFHAEFAALSFRSNPGTSSFYLFAVSRSGSFACTRVDHNVGSSTMVFETLLPGSLTMTTPFRLGVVMYNTKFSLYFNGTLLARFSDTTNPLAHGLIGVGIGSTVQSGQGSIDWSNVKVWQLPDNFAG